MKGLVLIGFLVWLFSGKQPQPTNNTAPNQAPKKKEENDNTGGTGGGGTGLTEPSNWGYAISAASNYGTDYFALLNLLSGGIAKFWFYGKSNGNALPSTGSRNGNGYETVRLCSHSINMHNDINESGGNRTDIICKVRYSIRDTFGHLVLFVEDTKGGGATYGRNNNHPDNCNRYLPVGGYELTFENLSESNVFEVNQKLLFGLQDENGTNYQINEFVPKGTSVVRNFTITDTGNTPNAIYTMNCNFLP